MPDEPHTALDLQEQVTRIDQMLADIHSKRQEVRLAPWQLVLAGLTSGAALFAAGAAFMKVFGGT